MKKLFGASLLVSGFVLLGFASPAMASSKSQRAHGAELFASSGCQHCHTIRNVGGTKGPNLSSVGRTKSEEAIRAQVVNGSKIMPAFGDVLQPSELDDVVAYLRSCKDKPKK
jgi:mono/diheme cytochrome c family protein